MPHRRVEKVDDLAGLGRTHPGVALLMVLFLFSLIGMPLTAGFAGKLMLFWDAMGLSGAEITATGKAKEELLEHVRLYRILALIGAVNAAIGGWYYLRVVAVMYLRDAVEPLPKQRPWPALACIWVCAALTLGLGVYPYPMVEAIRSAVPRRAEGQGPGVRSQGSAPGGETHAAGVGEWQGMKQPERERPALKGRGYQGQAG
jgi:NADH-quinone oxidoreductase subunit N